MAPFLVAATEVTSVADVDSEAHLATYRVPSSGARTAGDRRITHRSRGGVAHLRGSPPLWRAVHALHQHPEGGVLGSNRSGSEKLNLTLGKTKPDPRKN